MRTLLWRWSDEERENGVPYGGQAWLGWRTVDSFFPFCCGETAKLEEGVGNHRHECVAVKPLPASAVKVIKSEFLFHLLMCLLADPAPLDGFRQSAQAGVLR